MNLDALDIIQEARRDVLAGKKWDMPEKIGYWILCNAASWLISDGNQGTYRILRVGISGIADPLSEDIAGPLPEEVRQDIAA